MRHGILDECDCFKELFHGTVAERRLIYDTGTGFFTIVSVFLFDVISAWLIGI